MSEKFNYVKLSPFKWFVLENFPFIEADFDALTNWQLFCKLGNEMNKIIDSQNIVGEQAEQLTNAFNALQDYVNNYFENLDVQDEIDNKLDSMVEDGTFEQLIADYLSFEINIKVYGAKGDGITNDTSIIQQAINTGKPIYFPEGTYLITSLNCNDHKVNIRGAGINATNLKTYGNSTITTMIDASNNSDGFTIKDIRINGNNKCQNGIIAGNRNIGYNTTRKITINNVSIVNCTNEGLYLGGVSAVADNINVVNCDIGVHMESYGAVLTNSTISQCTNWGLILDNGNGYVTNNKIYLNNNGIKCNGLVYTMCNNNIQQNKNNGLEFGINSNSNIFSSGVFLANGWYEENETPPTDNYEIILQGYNNKIDSSTFIPFIKNWNSKRKAIIKNIDGFNNNVNLTFSRSLETSDNLNTIDYINAFLNIDGYNISNRINFNEINQNEELTDATIVASATTGTNVTNDLNDNIHDIILSNTTLSKWAQTSVTGLDGSGTRFIPSKTENVNGIYVEFERELSLQFNKLGIGHYLVYSPTGRIINTCIKCIACKINF